MNKYRVIYRINKKVPATTLVRYTGTSFLSIFTYPQKRIIRPGPPPCGPRGPR